MNTAIDTILEIGNLVVGAVLGLVALGFFVALAAALLNAA